MKLINLLPKPKQEELHYELLFHSFIIFFKLCAASFALVFIVQLGTKVYLDTQRAFIAEQIEQAKRDSSKEENELLKKRIRGINFYMSDYQTLRAQTPQWSAVLSEFAKVVPEDVVILTFVADRATRQIDITGQSPAREQVIALYNNVKSAGHVFYDINYPLENVSKPADIAFHFSFYVHEEALVK